MTIRKCNKIDYPTKTIASTHAREIRKQAKYKKQMSQNNKLRPYQCPICNLWHLCSGSGSRDIKLRRAQRTRDRRKSTLTHN